MANTKYFIEIDQPAEPSETDVLVYARQIGIDVNSEAHLMWIAKEGLGKRVPEPWIILADERNEIYYNNTQTGQSIWLHPIDQSCANLVRSERAKSLNSTGSDPGLESKLSSLADAPPLSSGGNKKPTFPKQSKPTKNDPKSKLDSGRFENRRGTQLSAVKLNALKMPVASSPAPISFMPRGSSLSRNLRRAKEEPVALKERLKSVTPSFDGNNSDHSEEGSKYSYEDSEEDEENLNPLETQSQLSPIHSTGISRSPEPLDLNNLVQLGTKLSSRLDIPKQLPKMSNKDSYTPLTRRNMQDQYSLKPMVKPKTTLPKKTKTLTKAVEGRAHSDQTDVSSDILNCEETDDEWKCKREMLENAEEVKWKELKTTLMKKFEEEESKLMRESEERLSQLHLKLDEEFAVVEKEGHYKIETFKKTNKEMLGREEQSFETKFALRKTEWEQKVEELELEKEKEIEQQKAKAREAMESVEGENASNIKSIRERHMAEVEMVEKEHQRRLVEQGENTVLGPDTKNQMNFEASLEDLKRLIKEEEEKYQTLKEEVLKMNNEIKSLVEKEERTQLELTAEKEALTQLANKKNVAQSDLDQLHDEVERLESDLDLLRNEKSTLLVELRALKESLVHHKSSSPSKLKRKDVACEMFVTTKNTSCQASAESVESACQTTNLVCIQVNRESQTEVCSQANRFCQVDSDLFGEDNQLPAQNGSANSVEALVNSSLDKAMGGLKVSIDEKIMSMEQHLRTLQEKLSAPLQDTAQHTMDNAVTRQSGHCNKGTEEKDNRNAPLCHYHTCDCGPIKDTRSFDIIQDLRNSVHNLNHIVNRSYVPHPCAVTPTRLDGFYQQYRHWQDRKSSTELSFRCQSEILKQSRAAAFENEYRSVPAKNISAYTSSMGNPNFNTNVNNGQDDPMTRARNIVLREQARIWKQQQQLLNSNPHLLDVNGQDVERYRYQAISSNVSTSFAVLPSFSSPFTPYEEDSSSDYNTWMTKLKELQQRIRSHKMV